MFSIETTVPRSLRSDDPEVSPVQLLSRLVAAAVGAETIHPSDLLMSPEDIGVLKRWMQIWWRRQSIPSDDWWPFASGPKADPYGILQPGTMRVRSAEGRAANRIWWSLAID